MGACCKTEEYEGDDATALKQTYKILFLGSGGCGKSTLLRQLRKLYGQGFTKKDKKDAVHSIAQFVIDTMKTLLEEEQCDIESFENDEAKKAAKEILAIATNSNSILSADIASNINLLWNEEHIKNLFNDTAKLYLNGPCAHFFDSMDRISSPEYEPTHLDILLQRRPTIGVIEQDIAQNDSGVQFLMMDVGGQRNERRKWIHQFENVSAIVYVISLSAYNEPLFEDENVNSLDDAISLFQEIINSESHWFKQSSLFIVFNKRDLFEQKIIKESLAKCFGDEYDENKYFLECKSDQEKIDKNKELIKNKFVQQIKDETKDVMTFETCAYEEEEVKNVFNTIFTNIVAKSKAIPP